jgi:type VI secretion system protein VasJ
MDLLTLGKESVSADRPGGQDVRYDPAFDELQAEVDKLSSPSASGSLNWEKIVRSAADILAHKSKDLLVASYLGVALIYTRKHDGLSIGIKLLLDLLEKFWDDLYPSKERMRGRVRSIEWWTEKTEVAVKNLPEGSVPSRQVAIMRENLEKIGQFMQKHLDSAPSVSQIMEYVERLAAEEEQQHQPAAPPQPVPQPVITQETPRTSAPPVRHSEPIIQDITSPQIAQRTLEQHFIKLREIASYLWQQDPANSMVYRLNRISVWITVDDLPPATSGKTRIPPPDNQSIKILFEMRNNGNTDALLKAAEGKLSQFIFWLDLNRFVAEALVRLGNRYQKAHEVVCRETAALLNRIPGLEELSFSDGMPFANSETRDWLRSIATASGSGSEESIPARQQTTANSADEKITQEISNAKGLIRKGKLIDAMVKLQKEQTHAVSRRDRILWRIAVSQMLVEEKQGKIALPHIEQILMDIDTYRLEEYEPALTLRALKLAWKGLEAQSDQANKLKANDILYRIARLDMAEAIRLGKN